MRKCLVGWLAVLGAVCAPQAWGGGADLTPTEARWLDGAWPVVTYARQAGLPLDIVVQPQDTPGAAPLAHAFIDGRCKLVLSMRGNPEAEATLRRIAPDMLDMALELMAAHELGHCRRSLDGAWQKLPSGFSAPAAVPHQDAAMGAARAEMSATRREEAYGDLVGLAWVAQRHPAHYGRLHAWLVRERSADHMPGSHHDTLAWLRLAASPNALGSATVFDAASALWLAGLEEQARRD